MKAFLSHSHADAEIVHAVAREVGRVFVALDTRTFRAADDLIATIEKAVRESAIFVLFASKDALDSAWVDFEINEARYHQALSRVRKSVVVLLDDRLQATDFPNWMQRALFLKSHSSKPIARALRGVIDDMVGEEQTNFFVGRASETASLQAALVPPDITKDVSIVTLRGLPGIGRRTLLQRVVKDSLFIERLLTVRVQVGDSANDIAIKLADLIEPAATAEDSLTLARSIADLEFDQACERFAQDAKRAMDLHELVVLYDEGGILDNEALPSPAIQRIAREVAKLPEALLALITNRRPAFREVEDLEESAIIDVGPLREAEVRQLLALEAKSKGIDFNAGAIGPLIEQIKGYPPSVTAVIGLAQTYGGELVAQSASVYQPRPLKRYLTALVLSPVEKKMLSILAKCSPLPLQILADFAPAGEQAVSSLRTLIDKSLVMPQPGTDWYRISDPIIDFVDREFESPSAEDYGFLANNLDGFLEKDRNAGSYLDLSRVLYRSLMHAGAEQLPRAYALASDWLKLAADFYHERNYKRAKEVALLAQEHSPSAEALTWIIKAEVKLGNATEALNEIDSLRALGRVRDAHFFRGFLERNRSDYANAIKYYELARQAGWGGLALERDLAECYLQTGNLDKASQHIEQAQSRQSDNRYVLSLRVKIACKQMDEDTARSLLPLIDEVDSPTFAAHRRSRVELTFGNIDEAHRQALRAVAAAESRPPAETLANLAHCQILKEDAAGATRTLTRLESLYENRWSDVVNGMKARIAMLENRYEDALALASLLKKGSRTHLRIERDALHGILEHVSMASERRGKYELRLAELEHLIADHGGFEEDLSLIDF